jgi:type II secretory pathway component PulC
MDKRLVEIIATVALVAALAVVVVMNLGKKKPRPLRPPILATESAPAAQPFNAAAPLAQPQGGEMPVLNDTKAKLQKEHAAKAWGRDPFVRTKALEAGYRTSSLELKGISIGTDKRGFALINQDIVRVGDKIEGCEVLSIEKNRVLLQKNGQSFYLKLPEEQIENISQKGVSK